MPRRARQRYEPDERKQRVVLSHSQRDLIVSALLDALETGQLAAGDKLVASTLATQFDVAAATVREALIRLHSLNVVDERNNRPSCIVTPTRKWYVAIAAECAGLSVAATDLGIAGADEDQRARFAAAAAAARELWAAPHVDQFAASTAVWNLLQLLAEYSGNEHLAAMHAEKRHALAFGIRHLGHPRNTGMLVTAIEALNVAVASGDRDEGVDIVRDLYAFVTVPFLEDLPRGSASLKLG